MEGQCQAELCGPEESIGSRQTSRGFLLLDLKKTLHTHFPAGEKFWNSYTGGRESHDARPKHRQ
jgi:hypothetical protein